MLEIKRNCLLCEKEFIPHKLTPYRQKFCSLECKSKYNNKKVIERNAKILTDLLMPHICPQCGKTYNPNRTHYLQQIYCSESCRKKARRNPRIKGEDYVKRYLEHVNIRQKEYDEKHKNELLDYQRKYQAMPESKRKAKEHSAEIWAKLRISALEKIANNHEVKCVKCGFSDIRALQIDHINSDGFIERKKLSDKRVFYRYVINEDINIIKLKYQILCANCNWIKRIENGEVWYKQNKV